MLGVNEVYNWQCLKSIRVMYLNISVPRLNRSSSEVYSPHPAAEAFLSANEESYGGHAFQVNT